MKNGIKIAIIDDGVSKCTIHDLCFDYCCHDGLIAENRDNISPFSHGSICAAIIKEYAPQAKIGSIRILDNETMRGNVSALASAISWCAEQKMSIVHLSIGSVATQDVIPLYKTISRVSDSFIIAACKNGRNVAFPASFPNVIGVKTDKVLIGNQYCVNLYPNSGIEFIASSRHIIELSSDLSEYETPICNSYAAPVLTSEVYQCLWNNPRLSFKEVKAELYNKLGAEIPDVDKNVRQYKDIVFDDKYPVIALQGSKAVFFALFIAKCFLQDGYLPLLLSSTQYEDSAFVYLDDIKSLESLCHSMAEYCGADVILAVVNEKEKDVVADVFIDCRDYNEMASMSYEFHFHINENNKYSTYKSLIGLLSEPQSDNLPGEII